MKKALITANSASMIKLFNQLNITILQSMGYEIHVACNFRSSNTISPEAVAMVTEEWKSRGIVVHQVDYLRSPFSWKSFHIYKQIKTLIRSEKFDLIHCHTPIVAAFTRLAAAKARRKGETKLFYTAHGFHFYRGAPLLNWLMYYPVEKLCSYLTDAILTINTEDWTFAKKHFQHSRVFYLPGIGVDIGSFSEKPDGVIDFQSLFNLRKDEKVMISVGEMTANKNQKTLIKALTGSRLKNVHYMIVGSGVCRPQLEKYASELKVSDRVHFLGYRKDVAALLQASDVFVFPSYREGLPVALMEAMSAGVPVVASRIRGNVDLIEDGVNGFLCDPDDADGFADKIRMLLDDPDLAAEFRNNGLEKIKGYDKNVIMEQLQKIYGEMNGREKIVAEEV